MNLLHRLFRDVTLAELLYPGREGDFPVARHSSESRRRHLQLRLRDPEVVSNCV